MCTCTILPKIRTPELHSGNGETNKSDYDASEQVVRVCAELRTRRYRQRRSPVWTWSLVQRDRTCAAVALAEDVGCEPLTGSAGPDEDAPAVAGGGVRLRAANQRAPKYRPASVTAQLAMRLCATSVPTSRQIQNAAMTIRNTGNPFSASDADTEMPPWQFTRAEAEL